MRHVSELYIWIAGLLYVALVPPDTFSICLFKFMGIWCPGCGLGHSVHHLLRGEFMQSFAEHPLGLPALCILIYRIYILSTLKPSKKTTLV